MRRLCFASLLLGMAASAALTQGRATSVYINTSPPVGTGNVTAASMASAVGNSVGGQLLKQFPCVDQIDSETAAAMLGWGREKELLGNPSPDLLAELGGAIGARYVVSVKGVALPNGQVDAEVTVIDTQTNTVVAREVSTPADPNGAYDAAEATAGKVMQDLSSTLNGQCDPHWTGTITITDEMKQEPGDVTDESPDGNGGKNVMRTQTSWQTVETTVVVLQAPKPKSTEQMARVVRGHGIMTISSTRPILGRHVDKQTPIRFGLASRIGLRVRRTIPGRIL